MDARSTRGERKDLEVYSSAVETAAGNPAEMQAKDYKDLVAYVEHPIQYLDGSAVAKNWTGFNYERWLGYA